MLKITKTERADRAVLLELDGSIADQWAALLDGECRAQLRRRKHLVLDCSRVRFIDANGLEVLHNLPPKHVTLIGANAFITASLQTGDD